MTVYTCSDCSVITEKKKCLLCGKATVKTKKKKIQRFPRERSKEEIANKATVQTIEQKCLEFDCPGRILGVRPGPVVTQFDFAPNRFVRVKRVRSMSEDLAMALSTENVSITRIPGQSAVAIMVPNKDRKIPSYADTLDAVIKVRNQMEIPLNFGVDSLGNPVVMDLARMPHLLVAGSTGAGKSVFLNCLITSLLYVRTPKQLQLYLIDPKTVELFQYKDLPHVQGQPASSVYDALRLLEITDQEMRKRLAFIHYKQCKNLKELNAKLKPEERLPYGLIIIDEMADLILQEKKAFITAMAGISSMARAAGIHVIASTQRPSVDVLSGKVKVNFPARISFQMPSSADSKTVLTTKGAEQLMARGDAFFMSPERSGLTRVHVPFIQEADVKRMIHLSTVVGHHLKTPAEITKAELRDLEKQLEDVREGQGRTPADLLDPGSKPKIPIQ